MNDDYGDPLGGFRALMIGVAASVALFWAPLLAWWLS